MKFCWTTLHVKDMGASLDFYQRIVGLEITMRMKPNESHEICFLGTGETKMELICDSRKDDVSYGADVSLGFEVDSLDDTIQNMEKEHIEIVEGPLQPSPNTRFIFVSDPNGMRVQFVERRK